MSLSLRSLIYGSDHEENEMQNDNKQQRVIEDDESSRSDSDSNTAKQKQVQRLDLQQDEEGVDMDEYNKAEKVAPDEAVIRSNTQIKSNYTIPTAARLDAIYASSNEPIKPDRVQSTVWFEPQLPNRQGRSEKRRYCRPGRPPYKDPQAALDLLETQPQAELRKQKRKLEAEWTTIRRQWKRRKFHFQQETDIGNAISRTVRDALQEQQSKPSKQEEYVEEEQEEDDENDDESNIADTSDEEQNAILNRMLKASQDSTEKQQDKESSQEQDLRPYAERLDYWERGL